MSWRAGLARVVASVTVLALAFAASVVASPVASAVDPGTSASALPASTSWLNTSQITVTTASTGAVTYGIDPASTPTVCAVSVSGVVSATGPGTCITDVDVAGDTTYDPSTALATVVFTQAAATTSAVASPPSALRSSTSTIDVTTNSAGAATFAIDVSSTASGCSVTTGGVVSTASVGTCVIDVDVASDANYEASSTTATVTFTSPGTSGGGTTTSLTQTSATAGAVTTSASGTFTAGPIAVAGNTGTVTFATTTPSPDLIVTSAGLISTTGTLEVGTYSVAGTDSDVRGDSGVWAYTLIVTAVTVVATVTFGANGGSGVMTPQSASQATALSLNKFVRKGYTFLNWNTVANGTGTSYANGAVFPFSSSTELFARWKRKAPGTKSITFIANGGKGSMAPEVKSTPTAIESNHFTRAGYTFVDWNTSQRGKGTKYKPGATYPFKKSITLYAQWKKVKKVPPKPALHDVIFLANGGTGSMAVEHHRTPATLTPNHFTRAGYTFLRWNTGANGYGISYANKATFSFSLSTNLYAQWTKNKVATPPPTTTTIPGSVAIGPFALGSTTLTPALESQVQNLAKEIKTKGDSLISLLGTGDKTPPTNESNAELGRQRAEAVASYLEARLNALGLKGWSISVTPESLGQSESATVTATLS